MTSPPSASVVSASSVGSLSTCTLWSHMPTAHMLLPPLSAPGPPRGEMLTQDISLPVSVRLSSVTFPSVTPSRTTVDEPVETMTCSALPAASVMLAPPPGVHSCTTVFMLALTSRRLFSVTWQRQSPLTLPHQIVCTAWSNPSSSVSPSSSSPISSTRVSPMKDWTKYLSNSASKASRRFHRPLMPGSSTWACSSIPMPFLTTRRLPSLSVPEHVTTWPCPCRSRSTTQRSWMGPRLVKLSSTSTLLPCSSLSWWSLISWLSPKLDPMKTTPESRYEMEVAQLVSPSTSSFMSRTLNAASCSKTST
mmetsp:Transcript_41028/g.102673  ORF Transcript_41028/g.102673 Transcript_41028/m.102673 type:complete len:306 (-) Transcript_41028:951-1868(-)